MKKVMKIVKFASENYIISLFFACILFVGFVFLFKMFFSSSRDLYIKIRVGQGLWWVGARPNHWFLPALKKGEVEKKLTGKIGAEILSVRHYTWEGPNLYDIYLTIKLKADFNKRTGKYLYKRSAVAVGSPIDFEFPSVTVSGSVIALSEKPFNEKYVEKTVQLVMPSAYSKSQPYSYENINIGDRFFDGEDVVFEVLEKQLRPNVWSVSDDLGLLHERDVYATQDIVIKAKIKVKKVAGQLIFGEDNVINLGRQIKISTENYNYTPIIINIQ